MKFLGIAIATLSLALAASAEAKPRPTVDAPNGDDCFNDPSTDKNTPECDGGAVCYCCYDDGCWVCGTTPLPGDSCVWDPAYRPKGTSKPTDAPTISPGQRPTQTPKRPPTTIPQQNPPVAPSK